MRLMRAAKMVRVTEGRAGELNWLALRLAPTNV